MQSRRGQGGRGGNWERGRAWERRVTDSKSSRATERAFGVEDSTVEDDDGLKHCQFETLPPTPIMTGAKAVGATAVAVQEVGLASSANIRLLGYNSTVKSKSFCPCRFANRHRSPVSCRESTL